MSRSGLLLVQRLEDDDLSGSIAALLMCLVLVF